MNTLIQLLRAVVIMLSLSLLAGYVWYSQKMASPPIVHDQRPPETVMVGSKSGTVNLGLVDESSQAAVVFDPPQTGQKVISVLDSWSKWLDGSPLSWRRPSMLSSSKSGGIFRPQATIQSESQNFGATQNLSLKSESDGLDENQRTTTSIAMIPQQMLRVNSIVSPYTLASPISSPPLPPLMSNGGGIQLTQPNEKDGILLSTPATPFSEPPFAELGVLSGPLFERVFKVESRSMMMAGSKAAPVFRSVDGLRGVWLFFWLIPPDKVSPVAATKSESEWVFSPISRGLKMVPWDGETPLKPKPIQILPDGSTPPGTPIVIKP